MDFGTTTNVNASYYQTTSAITDRDVGQKGSYYRQQRRKKKPATEDKTSQTRSRGEDSQHTIDIRV